MLLRDAQEQVRILYAARKHSAKDSTGMLSSNLDEAVSFLDKLQSTRKFDLKQTPDQKARAIGILLLITLGLANEWEVDSLEALKSVLLEECP